MGVGVDDVYVEGGINYDRLVTSFGLELVDDSLRERFVRITGQALHPLLARGLFFAHRDLNAVLDDYEAGRPFYVYTGRGPSEGLHLGHLVPFMVTRELQRVFDVPVVIQMTGDEKYLIKNVPLEEAEQLTRDNVRDIIALGFDPDKTFIFSNLTAMGFLYPGVLRMQKHINLSTVSAVFGVKGSDNVGRVAFAAIQAAPSFSSSFPAPLFNNYPDKLRCCVPCGVDQDPYFRVTRDVASRLKEPKPALLEGKFVPSLQGAERKMSASAVKSAIFLTDTPKQVKKKIGPAFSGGGASVEEQREHGADLSVDVAYAYLEVFLDDDAELAQIAADYSSGRMLTGEVKARLISVVNDILAAHAEARAAVDDALIDHFMTFRELAPCSFSAQE